MGGWLTGDGDDGQMAGWGGGGGGGGVGGVEERQTQRWWVGDGDSDDDDDDDDDSRMTHDNFSKSPEPALCWPELVFNGFSIRILSNTPQ